MGSEQNNAENLPPTVTLARLYEKQGFLDKAVAIYKKLIAVEPDRQDLRQALEDVERWHEGEKVQPRESEPRTILSQLTKWQTAICSRKKTLDQRQERDGKILVIYGQNLDMAGRKDRFSDGEVALEQIDRQIKTTAEACGTSADTFQSSDEDELVQQIFDASGRYDALIINPAGLSRTSTAIKDALTTLDIPVIEVHLSNTCSQEPSGQKSLISEVAIAHIAGFGKQGYLMAVQAAANMTATQKHCTRNSSLNVTPIRFTNRD